MESRYIHKSHNVSVLMYHVVCPAKYRRVVMSERVDELVKEDLWGGEFWGKGYLMNTFGQHGSEKVIAAYVKGQGGESSYRPLHKVQLDLELS